MAFTYGFYNSLNGDRKYNAFQMTQMFDGIILDGVFEAIGQHFAVTAASGMTVNVGTGRAWFNHTWNDNDSVMPVTLPLSDLNRSRYDAVVIEVGDPNTDRTNSIKVISGTPAVNPVKPTLNRGATNNDTLDPDSTTLPPYQHALAYILVKPGAAVITAADIEIVVGKDETPFVTGPIETRSIEELFNQWDAQFNTWFSNLQAQLTDNVVTNLQMQIDTNRQAIEEINSTFQVKEVVHTEIFTTSGRFENTTGKVLNVNIVLFGGGAGGGGSVGGGGGHRSSGNFTLAVGESVNIAIGPGGVKGGSSENGGVTSFGTYLSANGGSNNGNGGTGGGGMNPRATGASGSYGGGGGAGVVSTRTGTIAGGAGGNGGTYGGGGGGGGGSAKKGSSANGGNGGKGGSGCGAGGNGGKGGSGTLTGGNGSSGTNTLNMDLEFKGSGTGGSGSQGTYGDVTYSGGGGGGGGGYGGNGGSGARGETGSGSSPVLYGGAGGGGGGYGANGGNASSSCNMYGYGGAGGGGGGWGGKGGDANYSGQGYGAGGCARSEGGGGGGGGYGITPVSVEKQTNGNSGVCIITYITKDLIIN